ncbi:uncharacterized protein LOC130614498 [Hydractinia symbiolongicarpus]|uniref:uncharacterized protein LOC130614498 n=1 Tax=Hydractinia symbiolongicarpus TaxID=13093 RepID=UPI00254CC2AD|nr:uncharacterized protein LOC130614498 [Hydractinia symbiolongicarpus]
MTYVLMKRQLLKKAFLALRNKSGQTEAQKMKTSAILTAVMLLTCIRLSMQSSNDKRRRGSPWRRCHMICKNMYFDCLTDSAKETMRNNQLKTDMFRNMLTCKMKKKSCRKMCKVFLRVEVK